MKHCAHCHTGESRYTLPGTSTAVCSETCLLAYLFALVEAMSEDEARRRLGELLVRCAPGVDGRRGGLVSEESDLFLLICQRLGVEVTWEYFDLGTHEIREGRGSNG